MRSPASLPLADGTADAIATDHAPHREVDKAVEFGDGRQRDQRARDRARRGARGRRCRSAAAAPRDRGADDRARGACSAAGCGAARPGSSKARRRTSSSSIAPRPWTGDALTRSRRAARTRRCSGWSLRGRVLLTWPAAGWPTRRRTPDGPDCRDADACRVPLPDAEPSLNSDFERRSFWQATMPDAAGSVGSAAARNRPTSWSSVAGIPGSTRRASSPGAASRSRLIEAETLGYGASTRNGGIVHPGYKWGPRELVERYGDGDRPGALPGDARRLRDRQAADRRRGDRLRLPRASATSSSRTPRPTCAELEHAQASLASMGVETTMVPRDRIRDGDRLGRLLRRAGRPEQRAAPPGPVLRRARRRRPTAPAPTCTRASARGRSGAGPTAGSRSRRSAARSWRVTCSSARTATPTAPCRRCAGGSSRSGATSSPASHSPRSWHASSRRRAARSSIPRTSCTTGTCRRIGGWSSAVGRASCRPRSTGPRRSSTRACSRSTRSSPATGSTTRGAATSASPSTGCPTSGGPRRASPTRWAAAAPASR